MTPVPGACVTVLFAIVLVGCEQVPPKDTGDTGGGGGGGDDFCAVSELFDTNCTACHSASGAAGGLDLETDAYTALVGISSSLYDGRTLVVEGDPDASFLYVKVTGAQAGTEGDPMPPPDGLSAGEAETIRAWIADGASPDCGDTGRDTGSGNYHPDGWDAPDMHGMAAKLQEDTCASCHGEDLTGTDYAAGCDTCHDGGSDAWRTDCTFCHGTEADPSGAPPEGIRDETDADELSFPPHAAHTQATSLHAAFDCTQCHTKPTDIFSSGHLFVGDTTPGVADLSFAAGLSDDADWDGAGCSNLYCHGNGRSDNGAVQATDEVECGDCHAGPGAGESAWERMSGEHAEHLEEGLQCSSCHRDVVSGTGEITDLSKHVNGSVDVTLGDGMTRSGDTCTGTCHGESHSNRDWD